MFRSDPDSRFEILRLLYSQSLIFDLNRIAKKSLAESKTQKVSIPDTFHTPKGGNFQAPEFNLKAIEIP